MLHVRTNVVGFAWRAPGGCRWRAIIPQPLGDSGDRIRASNAFLHVALTPDDVSRIAYLARLELRADEARAMLAQLNGFFGIVERMGAVDTRGVEPL